MKLKDLKLFIDSLTEAQLDQDFRIVMDGEVYSCEEPEVIKDDIYVNNHDEEDNGTLEELKSIQPDFDITDYYESNQKGMVFFSID